MRHARQHAVTHSETRSRERRQHLAIEAARLISEGGIRDFLLANRKAAERLGIHDDASLPRNREIQQALRDYQRLFLAQSHSQVLHEHRKAAMRALAFFAEFEPRLVGGVLDGTADAHSTVCLHLYPDDAKRVPRFLADHQIPAEASSRRIRFNRDGCENVSVWLFAADSLPFDITVLPRDALRQAPFDPIDGKPMRRASLAALQELLAEPQKW